MRRAPETETAHPHLLGAGEMQIFPALGLLQPEDSHSTEGQINSWQITPQKVRRCFWRISGVFLTFWEVRNTSSTSGWAGTAPAWLCAGGAPVPAERFAVAFPVVEISAGKNFL